MKEDNIEIGRNDIEEGLSNLMIGYESSEMKFPDMPYSSGIAIGYSTPKHIRRNGGTFTMVLEPYQILLDKYHNLSPEQQLRFKEHIQDV